MSTQPPGAHHQQEPPPLNPAEAALEQSLSQTANPSYRALEWWRRTKYFCACWDQTRRRQGFLDSYFRDFGPRWRHPEWPHFNLARRQADARGALYEDWLAALADHQASQGPDQPLPPQELHGPQAITAWEERARACPEEHKIGGLCAQPYTLDNFNPRDPSHAAYAQALLQDITNLAGRVFNGQPEGVARLLAQAVDQGQLPLAALDLRPDLRARVVAALNQPGDRPDQGPPPPRGPGGLLI